MNIGIIGATGNIGRRILAEAVGRGHHVTAFTRDKAHLSKTDSSGRAVWKEVDVLNATSLETAIAGLDVLISTYQPGNASRDFNDTVQRSISDPTAFVTAAKALLKALERYPAMRLIVLGGAGSLEVKPGLQRVDSADDLRASLKELGLPEDYALAVRGHRDALNTNRLSDRLWTYLSPAEQIYLGERTGRFRIGGNQPVMDADGQSRISYEDCAVAIIDEAEITAPRPTAIHGRLLTDRKNMKAIVFDEIGSPADVLQLREIPVPEIGECDVLVRMLAASVNPGDFLFIENLYPEPKKPVVPGQIAGNHGTGVIVNVGKNAGFEVGTVVAFSYYNTWAEYAAVPAAWLIPLPHNSPVSVAAQFFNAITAWDLLHEAAVQPGQWLALTAGNSAVSTMVLNFAKLKKINVISIVRRAQSQLDLKAWGAAEIIELTKLSTDLTDRITEITCRNGLSAVIDCVGGPLATELIKSLTGGGQFVIYGGFSSEKFQLHNFDLLMKGAGMKSYIYRYFFDPPSASERPLLEEIAQLRAKPEFNIRIGGFHTLDDFKTAIHETLHQSESGKRLFRMSNQ